MTNPDMTKKATHWTVPALAVLLAAGVTAGLGTLPGCSGEEEPVAQLPPPPPPPPPPPSAPPVTPIDQLMAELNIDPRVKLPEDEAPGTDEQRRAVLVFFDAFARGNSAAVKSMLPVTEQADLEALVKSGAWKEATSKIEQISVQTGANDVGLDCALAVIEIEEPMGISFQPQLWYYTVEQEQPTFEAAPTPPGIMDKLSGDWIVAWHKILADELALANESDVEIQVAQREINEDAGGSSTPTAGPLAPMQGRPRPTGPPMKAPTGPGVPSGPGG